GFTVAEAAIREALLRCLEFPIDWLDITHGAAGQGIAVMLCELSVSARNSALRRIVDHLTAAQRDDGSWRVPPGVDGLSNQTLSGFAHGCAGIAYFLAACDSDIVRSEESWRRAASWLAANARRGNEGDSLNWAYSDKAAESWKWWCHGAPGIALTFLRLFRRT